MLPFHLFRKPFSLYTKFILLICAVGISTGVLLGWYVIDQHQKELTKSLKHTGGILVKNLAAISRYSVLTQDVLRLNQLMEGPLAIEEVVYVLFLDSEGRILASQGKGIHSSLLPAKGESPLPLQLDHLPFSPTPPSIFTPFIVGDINGQVGLKTLPEEGDSSDSFFAPPKEIIFDFAVPVFRRRSDSSFQDLQTIETEIGSSASVPTLYGFVRLGLSTAGLQEDFVANRIWLIQVMTILILCAVIVTIIATNRLIKPLRDLAHTAIRIGQGELTPTLKPTSRDEIGDLTRAFNTMTDSLKARDKQLARHVNNLEALNSLSSLINSASHLEGLFSDVSEFLLQKGYFSGIIIFSYEQRSREIRPAFSYGIPPSQLPRLQSLHWVLPEDDSPDTLTNLIHQEQSLLIPSMEEEGHLVPSPVRETFQSLGWNSMVFAPLQHPTEVFGFIVGARDSRPCSPSDENFLTALSHQMNVAMAKIDAYQDLARLAESLEERIAIRTKELEDANHRLLELDRLKSAFVSTASHELRTPLTSIHMFVDNMLKGVGGKLSDNHRHYLSRIQTNVQRLRRMISQLLDLSRIESGKIHLQFQPCHLRALLEAAVESLRPLGEEKDIDFSLICPKDLPPMLADEDKFHQILTNLIHNSIKFTPAGGKISVIADKPDEYSFRISIQDTGCGIQPEERDRLFAPFTQGQSGSKSGVGAGLGLAVTKHLVELHGGTISLDNLPQEGTNVTISVPIHHDAMMPRERTPV